MCTPQALLCAAGREQNIGKTDDVCKSVRGGGGGHTGGLYFIYFAR